MSFRTQLGSLVLGLSIALCGSAAFAQPQAGGLDRAIVSATGPLNDTQKSAVAAFVSKNAQVIKTASDARSLEEARLALASAPRDPGSGVGFRKAYGQALVAELGAVAKDKDLRRALAALQALRFSRSTEGFDVLLDRTIAANEPNAAKRIAAASLVVDGFEDLDASNAYIESAARRLRDAVAAEKDWIALQQKLVAIGSAARRKDFPAENARNVRKSQAEAIATLATAMKSSSAADPRMQAIQRVVVGLRNELLAMPTADRSSVSRALAPALADLLGCAGAHWDSAHADASLSAAYASVLNNCELLLRLIDRGERPQAYSGSKPEGEAKVLSAAWDAKEKDKFQAEVDRWSGIVRGAPYKN